MERTADLVDGVAMARAAIRDGRAMQKLRDWVTWQNADDVPHTATSSVKPRQFDSGTLDTGASAGEGAAHRT